jgi:hypothetical protein
MCLMGNQGPRDRWVAGLLLFSPERAGRGERWRFAPYPESNGRGTTFKNSVGHRVTQQTHQRASQRILEAVRRSEVRRSLSAQAFREKSNWTNRSPSRLESTGTASIGRDVTDCHAMMQRHNCVQCTSPMAQIAVRKAAAGFLTWPSGTQPARVPDDNDGIANTRA